MLDIYSHILLHSFQPYEPYELHTFATGRGGFVHHVNHTLIITKKPYSPVLEPVNPGQYSCSESKKLQKLNTGVCFDDPSSGPHGIHPVILAVSSKS